jgi:hypothetical protein
VAPGAPDRSTLAGLQRVQRERRRIRNLVVSQAVIGGGVGAALAWAFARRAWPAAAAAAAATPAPLLPSADPFDGTFATAMRTRSMGGTLSLGRRLGRVGRLPLAAAVGALLGVVASGAALPPADAAFLRTQPPPQPAELHAAARAAQPGRRFFVGTGVHDEDETTDGAAATAAARVRAVTAQELVGASVDAGKPDVEAPVGGGGGRDGGGGGGGGGGAAAAAAAAPPRA